MYVVSKIDLCGKIELSRTNGLASTEATSVKEQIWLPNQTMIMFYMHMLEKWIFIWVKIAASITGVAVTEIIKEK